MGLKQPPDSDTYAPQKARFYPARGQRAFWKNELSDVAKKFESDDASERHLWSCL